jgi:hypothetical protein
MSYRHPVRNFIVEGNRGQVKFVRTSSKPLDILTLTRGAKRYYGSVVDGWGLKNRIQKNFYGEGPGEFVSVYDNSKGDIVYNPQEFITGLSGFQPGEHATMQIDSDGTLTIRRANGGQKAAVLLPATKEYDRIVQWRKTSTPGKPPRVMRVAKVGGLSKEDDEYISS